MENALVEIVGLVVGFGMLGLFAVAVSIVNLFYLLEISRKLSQSESKRSNQNDNDNCDDKKDNVH